MIRNLYSDLLFSLVALFGMHANINNFFATIIYYVYNVTQK